MIQLIDIIPSEWKEEDGKFYLMQTVYQCLFFSPEQHNLPYVTGLIGNVVYLIVDLQEGLKYNDFATEWSVRENDAHVTGTVYSDVTPTGPHVLLYTPHNPGESETPALERLEWAVGLLNAIEGKNASLVHRFSQTFSFPNGTTSGASPAELSPATYPRPFQDLTRLPDIEKRLSSLTDIKLKGRIFTALRWYEKSERESDALDAFLKIWFALEVLAMPGTDVRPIVELLAIIYCMTYEESKAHFEVGRIQGLRSRIVHNGETVLIHYQLQKYLQAIFVDILMYFIGHPSEKRADAILSDASVTLSDWKP